jgi:hypothetical protein
MLRTVILFWISPKSPKPELQENPSEWLLVSSLCSGV